MTELTAQEYADIMEELDRRGIHYEKSKGDDVYFKCSVNPFYPEELTETIALWHKIGNDYTFHRSNQMLVIKNTHFHIQK
jgi:hypothetical protein